VRSQARENIPFDVCARIAAKAALARQRARAQESRDRSLAMGNVTFETQTTIANERATPFAYKDARAVAITQFERNYPSA
jgi:hypothetical protein